MKFISETEVDMVNIWPQIGLVFRGFMLRQTGGSYNKHWQDG